MKRLANIIAAAVIAALFMHGCAPEPPTSPDVIIITLDTTRADHFGCYGNKSIKTPNFDRFAGESVRFDNCFSTCNSTLPSHVSIFTSLYMRDHGIMHNRQTVPEIPSIMPRVFKERGYQTAAFTSGSHLNEVAGIDRGFDMFFSPGVGLESTAGYTNGNVFPWLSGRGHEAGPLFLWVHYFDPHFTYDPPRPFKAMYNYTSSRRIEVTTRSVADPSKTQVIEVDPAVYRGLYMGEVSYMDHEFGRLLDSLRELGLYDDSIIVVVADHGESLGEHDIYWNHAGLYDTTIRVPLFIRLPGGAHAGVREQLVSTVDIYPTLMELAFGGGIDAPQAGESLTSILSDPSAAPVREEAYFEDLHEEAVGIRTREYLYQRRAYYNAKSPDRALIKDPKNRYLLFDCYADPGQNKSVSAQRPDIAAGFNRDALEFLQNPIAGYKAEDVSDKKQIDRLKALGYVQ